MPLCLRRYVLRCQSCTRCYSWFTVPQPVEATMGKERLGPPEHPAVSPVPRSSRDPFPVAAAVDRGPSHETKGQSLCLICIGGRLAKAFLRILRGLFRGLLFGFLRGSLKALSKAPQLLNVISRQNHIWPVEREEYPEKRAIISAQSRFRLDADLGWMPQQGIRNQPLVQLRLTEKPAA